MKKDIEKGKLVYSEALCSKGKDPEALQKLDDKTNQAFKDPEIIYEYVYGRNYFTIRNEYAFLSYSKIPERAYHFASSLKKYGQTNCLGAILITVIPKDEYIELRRLDIEHWEKTDLQAYLESDPEKKETLCQNHWEKNYEVLLTTRAQVIGIVPIEIDILGKSQNEQRGMIKQEEGEYCSDCWQIAKRYVEKNNGIVVCTANETFTANESFVCLEEAEIKHWSSRVKLVNPTKIQDLVFFNENSSDTFLTMEHRVSFGTPISSEKDDTSIS